MNKDVNVDSRKSATPCTLHRECAIALACTLFTGCVVTPAAQDDAVSTQSALDQDCTPSANSQNPPASTSLATDPNSQPSTGKKPCVRVVSDTVIRHSTRENAGTPIHMGGND